MKSPNTINDPHLPSLRGGGQGFKESFSKFYSDMARRAWLVLKNVCKAGILNLCRRSITINESSGFVNMWLTRVRLTCSWNTWLHLNIIASNKENLQRCTWTWFCLFIIYHYRAPIFKFFLYKNGERKKKIEKQTRSWIPPWEHVNFKDQIEHYFKTVRQLNDFRLNPKIEFPCNIVTKFNIEKVFGPSCSNLKVTCPCLHTETKQELLRLYWQVFGTPHVINNEFSVWFVRGYIT